MERRRVHARGGGMEVKRVVGIGLEKPVEQEPGVAGGCAGTVLVAGPLAVDVNEVDAALSWAMGAPCLQGRAGDIQHRQNST